ncbi:hypothetical protein [Alteromonas sp. KUL49]|uniref:hypothetical protein n=1 Tax=Alteromonas sp. KUL49 TaxID=2480798 RepID=UPI00102F1815|nr:hypothetical protein [Alteromonas sp. KUL49]TAP40949.1 hypothetical protein EYS00_07535 [Alteromonas sp. KUL49]GEA11131.1 hypothetical protein KUL49_15060 [Alteromonas sp. KUL49]
MKYEVLWKELWLTLTKFMSLAICIPLIFVFVVRFFKSDFSLEVTFEHISILELPLFFGGFIGFSAAISFLIALYIRASAVRVEGGYLVGRNYWCFKRQIPVKHISQIYPFSNNGIEALVADGGVYGKVYISTHTKNLDKLLEQLKAEGANVDA